MGIKDFYLAGLWFIIKDSGIVKIRFYSYKQYLLFFNIVNIDNKQLLNLKECCCMPFGKNEQGKPFYTLHDGSLIEKFINENKEKFITDEKYYEFFKPITDKFLFDKLEPKLQEGIVHSKEMKTNFKLFKLQTEKDDIKFLLICEYVSILRDDGNISLEFKTEDKTEQFCYIRKPLEN